MKNYNRIGSEYDATRRADSYLVSRLAHHPTIKPRGIYLDAACGTGNYTIALTEKFGGEWFGVDESAEMLDTAFWKDGCVKWKLADVVALPFDSATFEGAICTPAIHHFENLPLAFSEIRRVLKPESAFVIFTATPEQTGNYWLKEYFPAAIEKSAAALPDLQMIADALQAAGFSRIATESYEVREDLQDLFLYSGKYKPELYLDERIRANISTFALLADTSEVEAGCRRLAADTKSGRIQSVIEQHKNSSDYLFVIAET